MNHSSAGEATRLLAPSRPVRRVGVIFNPAAGAAKGRRLRRTIAALEAHGCSVTLWDTARRGDAEAFAAALDPAEVDAVVAAGGDGTISEVLNGLLANPADEVPPLGIIPLGTANVLAHEMGLSLHPRAVAATIAAGRSRAVYPARLDGRAFLLMAGAGFDAMVVEHVRLGLKRRTGKLAYVVETLIQAVRYSFPPVTGTVDGRPFTAATAVVVNGRLYGGPFVVAPTGDLGRPDLTLVLLERPGLGAVLRYAMAMARDRLPTRPDVQVIPCAEVCIDAPAAGPVQADGDAVGRLPLRVTPAAMPIRLLWPVPG